MDVLFTGDIPQEYHFAIFGNGYIDLYNTNVLYNNTYTRYRVFTNCNGFYYDVSQVNYGSYYNTYATDITTTSNVCYRSDFDSILVITCIISVFAIWLLNIMTSCIRKGGSLGGLL